MGVARRLAQVMLLAACVALSGCGANTRPEPKRFPVHGTVTLDEKPLAEGQVYFKTIATGAVDSIDIKDGKFTGTAEPGERRVEICAYQTIQAPSNDPMNTTTQKNLVAARYNVDSKLTAKVAPDGPNEFTFKVTSP